MCHCANNNGNANSKRLRLGRQTAPDDDIQHISLSRPSILGIPYLSSLTAVSKRARSRCFLPATAIFIIIRPFHIEHPTTLHDTPTTQATLPRYCVIDDPVSTRHLTYADKAQHILTSSTTQLLRLALSRSAARRWRSCNVYSRPTHRLLMTGSPEKRKNNHTGLTAFSPCRPNEKSKRTYSHPPDTTRFAVQYGLLFNSRSLFTGR